MEAGLKMDWSDVFLIVVGAVALIIALLMILSPDKCGDEWDCFNQRVEACQQSELFTRDECLIIISNEGD